MPHSARWSLGTGHSLKKKMMRTPTCHILHAGRWALDVAHMLVEMRRAVSMLMGVRSFKTLEKRSAN